MLHRLTLPDGTTLSHTDDASAQWRLWRLATVYAYMMADSGDVPYSELIDHEGFLIAVLDSDNPLDLRLSDKVLTLNAWEFVGEHVNNVEFYTDDQFTLTDNYFEVGAQIEDLAAA